MAVSLPLVLLAAAGGVVVAKRMAAKGKGPSVQVSFPLPQEPQRTPPPDVKAESVKGSLTRAISLGADQDDRVRAAGAAPSTVKLLRLPAMESGGAYRLEVVAAVKKDGCSRWRFVVDIVRGIVSVSGSWSGTCDGESAMNPRVLDQNDVWLEITPKGDVMLTLSSRGIPVDRFEWFVDKNGAKIDCVPQGGCFIWERQLAGLTAAWVGWPERGLGLLP